MNIRTCLYLALGLLILATSARVYVVLSDDSGEDSLVLSKRQFDWIGVPSNSKLRDQVTLRNQGKEPLELLSVKSSCSCTTLKDVGGSLLQPGQSLEVPFAMNTGTMGQDAAELEIAWKPAGGTKSFLSRIELHATTVNFLSTNETVVDLGTLDGGRETARKVHFTKMKGVVVKEVRSGSGLVTADFAAGNQAEAGEMDLSLSVNRPSDLPLGIFKDELTVFYEAGGISGQYGLLVRGIHLPTGMKLSPDSLYLGVLKPGETLRKEIAISAQGDSLDYASCGSQGWTVEARPGKDKLKLVCAYTGPEKKGNISDTLILKMRDRQSQERLLVVPYYGFVKAD